MQAERDAERKYVLGSSADELARLDAQAASIERPTRLLLQAAGVTTGMRVLDLGTGLGHVARLAAEMVGPEGSVVGIDQSAAALAVARERTARAGLTQVSFAEGNVLEWQPPAAFDAIVGRLLLFHLAEPSVAVRQYLQYLRPGGLFIAVDFDLGAVRAEPPLEIVDTPLRWVHEAFRAAGAWPRIGARLGPILEEAGVASVTTFGVQPFVSPNDPVGPRLLAGVVRTLAPAMIAHGIATADQIDVATLEQRMTEAVRGANAVIVLPTVVGAWGRR